MENITTHHKNKMFKANDEKMLNSLYEQAIIMYENSNQSVMILINLMKKRSLGTIYNRSS